jgi:hypothetical protein
MCNYKKRDLLAKKKAESLSDILTFCVQYDLKISICKESLQIVLPQGAELSVNFDSGCVCGSLDNMRLIYRQLAYVKEVLRDLKINN